MTKDNIETKLNEKRQELTALQQSHTAQAEQWQKTAAQNQQRAHELQGAIVVLEEFLKDGAEPPP